MTCIVKKAVYFALDIPNRPGEAARVLGTLADAGVNLLAFTGFPCGRKAQIDLIPGYALIGGVRENGSLEWAEQTEVDWDMQRPASNPREFVCLACNEKFGGEALGI